MQLALETCHGPLGVTSMSTFEAVLYPTGLPCNSQPEANAAHKERMYKDIYVPYIITLNVEITIVNQTHLSF